jgi:L-alanine-DL-glutamate epimerase-like enolase superfamily enzyme
MGARLSLEVAIERLPLCNPFRISGYTFTDIPVVLVQLRRNGCVGRGEAAGVYYLKDTPEAAAATIEARRADIERGVTRDELRALLPVGGARNALDCALWDLEAKEARRAVWRLAGLSEITPRITTFTLGADDPATIVQRAAEYVGARALKLKLTGEVDADIERVRTLRAHAPKVWLGVDANQGFTPQTLDRILPVLADCGVALLEQPFARGKEADVEGLNIPMPVAADESVQGLADIASAVGRFNTINIKLDKCGGLTEALLMVGECRRLGLRVMVGNMMGTSLAMAPAFIVSQLCDVSDLDGPVFLAADRSARVTYSDGRIWCPESVWGDSAARSLSGEALLAYCDALRTPRA